MTIHSGTEGIGRDETIMCFSILHECALSLGLFCVGRETGGQQQQKWGETRTQGYMDILHFTTTHIFMETDTLFSPLVCVWSQKSLFYSMSTDDDELYRNKMKNRIFINIK